MKSTTNPKLNVRLLRRIKKHILDRPTRFFMESYVDQGTPGGRTCGFTDQAKRYPECGTTACIAGWANILTGAKADWEIRDAGRASDKLGLQPGQGCLLFCDLNWPKAFADDYEKASTPLQRVKIAAARIEHLISTGN